MMIEDSREYYAEMKLYNDVMGIALAVWGNAGDCPLFHAIDKALDNYNLKELNCIKDAFGMLADHVQRDIMTDIKTGETIQAIEKLQENYNALMKAETVRSA